VLALTAVLVLAWVGVLLRNYELGREAALRAFFGPAPNRLERSRDLGRLEDAQLLDPNAYWRLARANYHLLDDDPASAARTAESLVRDEPENIFAWGALAQATRRSNPRRSAQAAEEIRRLNPLGAR
jgi:hypothetical protein